MAASTFSTSYPSISLDILVSQLCPHPQIIPEHYTTSFTPIRPELGLPIEMIPLPVEFDALVPLDRIHTIRWDPSEKHTLFKSILLQLFESTRLLGRQHLNEQAVTIWNELTAATQVRQKSIDQLDNSTALQTWLINQLHVNLLIFVWGSDGINTVEERNMTYDEGYKNPFLPTILLFRPSEDIYQPIITQSADMIWTNDPNNLLRRIYVAIRPFLKSTLPDEVSRLLFAPLHAPAAIEGVLEKKTLAELQLLALERGISTTKTSATTGHQIRKMKAELIAELVVHAKGAVGGNSSPSTL